jgi:hypothetical protein
VYEFCGIDMMVNCGGLYTTKQSKKYPANNREELYVANCGNSIAFDVQVQNENVKEARVCTSLSLSHACMHTHTHTHTHTVIFF